LLLELRFSSHGEPFLYCFGEFFWQPKLVGVPSLKFSRSLWAIDYSDVSGAHNGNNPWLDKAIVVLAQ
jgi:hypothetical protein